MSNNETYPGQGNPYPNYQYDPNQTQPGQNPAYQPGYGQVPQGFEQPPQAGYYQQPTQPVPPIPPAGPNQAGQEGKNGKASGKKKSRGLTAALIVLLVAVLALGGVVAWMFFGKSSKTVSKAKAIEVEKWHKEVSFERAPGNDMKVYGAFNAASDEYLLFTPELKGSKITPLDFNSGNETKTPYIVPTCKGGQYPLALKDGQIICNPDPAKEPENKLPTGYKAKISNENNKDDKDKGDSDKAGKKEKVKVTLVAKPNAPKVDEKKKNFDAIKKFDFGNATWKNGEQFGIPEYKFTNGKATKDKATLTYLPDKTMYADLNGDRYLDAYTIFVEKAPNLYGDGGSSMYYGGAYAWVWDPKENTAKPVPRANLSTAEGDGRGQSSEEKALDTIKEFVIEKDGKIYRKTFGKSSTEHPLGIFKGYPIALDNNASCEQYIGGGAPYIDTASVDNLTLRGAPFPDAPLIDKSKLKEAFPDADGTGSGPKMYWLHFKDEQNRGLFRGYDVP